MNSDAIWPRRCSRLLATDSSRIRCGPSPGFNDVVDDSAQRQRGKTQPVQGQTAVLAGDNVYGIFNERCDGFFSPAPYLLLCGSRSTLADGTFPVWMVVSVSYSVNGFPWRKSHDSLGHHYVFALPVRVCVCVGGWVYSAVHMLAHNRTNHGPQKLPLCLSINLHLPTSPFHLHLHLHLCFYYLLIQQYSSFLSSQRWHFATQVPKNDKHLSFFTSHHYDGCYIHYIKAR